MIEAVAIISGRRVARNFFRSNDSRHGRI